MLTKNQLKQYAACMKALEKIEEYIDEKADTKRGYTYIVAVEYISVLIDDTINALEAVKNEA